MGFFDWILKYKFDNEKQTLIDLRTHTIDWYNQLTEPIEPLLSDIRFNQNEIDDEAARKYSEIARQIFKIQIISGAGGRLENVLSSMTKKGIPIFTSRAKLKKLAEEYQDSGMFIKVLAAELHNWNYFNTKEKENIRKKIFDGWQKFENKKDELVDEINTQIGNLG